jgi:hypothetical protein
MDQVPLGTVDQGVRTAAKKFAFVHWQLSSAVSARYRMTPQLLAFVPVPVVYS